MSITDTVKVNFLEHKFPSDVEDFKWLAADGRFVRPKDMTTRHLFYTLRMIWNHTVPEHMKFKPYIRYVFPEFYSNQYMILAVRYMMKELLSRTHCEEFVGTVLEMRRHLIDYDNGKTNERRLIS